MYLGWDVTRIWEPIDWVTLSNLSVPRKEERNGLHSSSFLLPCEWLAGWGSGWSSSPRQPCLGLATAPEFLIIWGVSHVLGPTPGRLWELAVVMPPVD